MALGFRAVQQRTHREVMMATGTWHIFLTLASLLVVLLGRMPLWMMLMAGVSFIGPPKLFGWAVKGGRWDREAAADG